jgi:hypothetical protein
LTTFVSFKLCHADTLCERQFGQVDAEDASKRPTDLQAAGSSPVAGIVSWLTGEGAVKWKHCRN